MVWILTLAVAAGVARRLFLFLIVIASVGAAALVRRRPSWLFLILVAAGAAALGARASSNYARDCEAVERMSAVAGAANVTLDGIVGGFPQSGPQGTTFDFITRIEGRRVCLVVRAE
ncbi:MAG TPA: hypothetical protein VN852_04405, partial [Candidatus Krumholzibacteria bacterium]|nr:hypothetical protein [Candidatus Krumholzibacteria bacterium]